MNFFAKVVGIEFDWADRCIDVFKLDQIGKCGDVFESDRVHGGIGIEEREE